MTQPYFSVGEDVILVSKERPDLNGEYTIRGVYEPDDTFVCRFSGINVYNSTSNLGYTLEETIVTGINSRGEEVEMVWTQSALRKKYPKGDSFDTLMSSLKSGMPVE